MKLWKVAATVAMGVFASGVGFIQADAALYTFSVDFETKTVANFDDFTQSYYSTTYDLGATMTINFSGSYSFASCPAPITVNVNYEGYWRLNNGGPIKDFRSTPLPDFPCTTTITTYSTLINVPVSNDFIAAIIDNDANFATINSAFSFAQNLGTSGLRLRLHNWTTFATINYEFDTTYLFNFILSDTQAFDVFFGNAGGSTWTSGSDKVIKVDYVYTTAGNDEYRIVNTNVASIGTLRRRYAVDYNNEYFRGDSVGARVRHAMDTLPPYTYDELFMGSSGSAFINNRWNYFFINASNKEQEINNVPEFEYEYEDCGWNAFDIPCFINNGLAYIVNDAPVISDAFTLLNAGMKLGGQAFAVIGQFSDNNIFGVLILGGLGITAVRWFLKND